jgi:transposase
MPKVKLTEEIFTYIVDNWQNKTIDEIATELEVSRSTIYHWKRAAESQGFVFPPKTSKVQRIMNDIINK